ncbi:oligosaccharide repeat unit polymerase [Agarivorans sp. TSD2052]|uniref:O-antigen polymerase n=1 Tax=Agarivorans sp. TSD2052 TaxID=2937286 RepID=UPI00200C420F|nr:O-antigen polymerase [Agarivorans sp. TSD2052]UPW20094.1 oligosaccharide repeat unit polymerase [Agarivorans sp. TSD2052]
MSLSVESLFATIVAFAMLTFSFVSYKDFRHPAVLHSLVWSSILFLHSFMPHSLNAAGANVLLVVVGALLSFAAGCLLVTALYQTNANAQIKPSYNLRKYRGFYKVYIAIALLGIPFVFRKAQQIASHGTTGSFMLNLRLGLNHEAFGNQSFGILAYISLIAFAAVYLTALDYKSKNGRLTFLLAIVIACFYVVMSTGRTYFFLVIIPILFVFSFTNPSKMGLKSFILGFVTIIGFFFFIGVVMGKVGENAGEAMSSFSLYLLGGVSAFDVVLSQPYDLQYGSNTLRTFFAILAKIGFEFEPVKLVKPYVYIPQATNVYTVFYPYYLDYGLTYVFATQFGFGVLHTVLYKRALLGQYGFVLAYSLSVYALFIQWFQDQYLSLLTTWVIIGFLLSTPLLLSRKLN